MLSIAITIFFALALFASLLTIAIMFHGYQDKIKTVLMAGLGVDVTVSPVASPRKAGPAVRAYRSSPRRHSFQPAPMRAAA